MQVVGRYALFDEIARGGMASVHLGRLLGQGGFSRTVAIKRLHPHLAKDPEFVTMLLDEARLAGRIQHPNVVAMLDVVASGGELMIVMEHVQGESLMRLIRLAKERGERVPPPIAVAAVASALRGLHAAHEVRGETGEFLSLVHRDVTPHNIMVRRDGTALVLDFGVAKATGRFHTTEEGRIKGKLPYMAPEQLRGKPVTRKTDIYAAGCVLHETLTCTRLFSGANEGELLEQVLFGKVDPPSKLAPDVPPALDAIVMRAIARNPDRRFETAAEMASELERSLPVALTSEVGAWVEDLAKDALTAQAVRVREIESGARVSVHDLADALRAIEARDATIADDAAAPAAAPVSSTSPPTIVAPREEIGGATSASMSSAVRASVREPASRWPWIAGAAAIALVIGAWLFLRGPATTEGPASSPALATPGSTSVATVTPGDAPLDSGARAAAPEASIPTATARVVAQPRPTPRAPAAAPIPRPSPESCVTIGPDGRKKYDRECLKRSGQ